MDLIFIGNMMMKKLINLIGNYLSRKTDNTRWVYYDYDDVYIKKSNLRYDPSTGRIQLFDVDGWCDGAPIDGMTCRIYGVSQEQQQKAIDKLQVYVRTQIPVFITP